MKAKFYSVVIALLAAHSGFSEINYPDFMVSLTRNGKDFHLCESIRDCQSIQNLEFLRICYANNVLLAKQPNETVRIPKIVHQIWLGSPVPEKYFAWMQTWMGWHGWEYRLWTDDDIAMFPLYNQELSNRSRSYGEITDVLRLEILLHFGGIYVDVDFQCLNQAMFEEFGKTFDFYVGFEPIEHGIINGIPKICNAIIAATPYHPIIKDLIVNMKSNWVLHERETGVQKAGPDYFSRTILDYEKGLILCPEKERDNTQYRNMYFPCTFFYPISAIDMRTIQSPEKLFSLISQDTAAIHYWSGSWR